MFEKLPSLRGFQPKFYSGGPARFHLPLLYDLVAETKPKRVIALGFGDGQAFFTFCQAASEQKIDCECIAVRRDRPGSLAPLLSRSSPPVPDGSYPSGYLRSSCRVS